MAKLDIGSIAGGAISAGGEVLSSIFSGIFNKKAATTAFHRQKALMDKQYNQNQQSLRDSPLSSLQGYRNAGMNAGAMLGQGAPQAAPVSGGNADQAAPMDTSGIAQAMQSAANLRLTNAQRENVEADTEGKDIQNALNKKYGDKDRSLQQDVMNNQMQLNLAYLRNADAKTTNQEIINKTAQQMQEAALRKLNLEGDYQVLQNSLKSQENSWYGIKMQQDIDESASRISKNAAETAYFKAYIPLLSAMIKNQNAQAGLADAQAGLVGVQEDLAKKDLDNYDVRFSKEMEKITAGYHELYALASLHQTDAELKQAQTVIQKLIAPYVGEQQAAEIAEKYSRTAMQGAATAKYGAEAVESGTRSVLNAEDAANPYRFVNGKKR